MAFQGTASACLAVICAAMASSGCDRGPQGDPAAAPQALASTPSEAPASTAPTAKAAPSQAPASQAPASQAPAATACPPLPATGLPDAATISAYGSLCEGTLAVLNESEAQAAVLAWTWLLWLQQPAGGGPVWQTQFQEASQVFLPAGEGGVVPAPTWAPTQAPPAEVVAMAKKAGLPAGAIQHLPYDQQADGRTLADFDNFNVRYQIRMNRTTFDHMVKDTLYSRAGQKAAAQKVKPGTFATWFPQDAWEMKTSWVWIPTGAKDPKYATLEKDFLVVTGWWNAGTAAQPKYQVGRAALTGLHLTNKLVPQWVWLTFEQLEDTTFTKVTREDKGGAIPTPAAAAANTRFQTALAAQKNPLAKYSLIGVQWNFEQDGEPTLLANSQIESHFQGNSSCVTCHSVSAISGTTGAYFNMVDPSDKGLGYYVGPMPTKRIADGGFAPLDYVWSLRHAH